MLKISNPINLFDQATRRWIAGLVVAVVFLAAPMARAQTFLTDAELLDAIPGMTVFSKSDRGTPWAQNYSVSDVDDAKKGAIRGIFGKRKYYAKWYVRDGKWCENWGSGQACWSVERVDSTSLRMYIGAKPRPNLWHLKPIEAPKA